MSTRRCRSGSYCTEDAVPGERFCRRHGEQLARVRAELEREAAERSRRIKGTGRREPELAEPVGVPASAA